MLIDIGISYRSLNFVAAKTGIDISSISAVINTHSHSDHCKGIGTFLKKHGIPVYTHNEGKNSLIKAARIEERDIQVFDKSFNVGSLMVTPFLVPHDAPVCCGFSVESGGKKISLATDLGKADDGILEYFYGSDIAVIESNHDTDMLTEGGYPYCLKKRIMSDFGHLSNMSCAQAAYKLLCRGSKNFILAHLSEENNLPELAFSSVSGYMQANGAAQGRDYTLAVASQHKPTKMFGV